MSYRPQLCFEDNTVCIPRREYHRSTESLQTSRAFPRWFTLWRWPNNTDKLSLDANPLPCSFVPPFPDRSDSAQEVYNNTTDPAVAFNWQINLGWLDRPRALPFAVSLLNVRARMEWTLRHYGTSATRILLDVDHSRSLLHLTPVLQRTWLLFFSVSEGFVSFAQLKQYCPPIPPSLPKKERMKKRTKRGF